MLPEEFLYLFHQGSRNGGSGDSDEAFELDDDTLLVLAADLHKGTLHPHEGASDDTDAVALLEIELGGVEIDGLLILRACHADEVGHVVIRYDHRHIKAFAQLCHGADVYQSFWYLNKGLSVHMDKEIAGECAFLHPDKTAMSVSLAFFLHRHETLHPKTRLNSLLEEGFFAWSTTKYVPLHNRC